MEKCNTANHHLSKVLKFGDFDNLAAQASLAVANANELASQLDKLLSSNRGKFGKVLELGYWRDGLLTSMTAAEASLGARKKLKDAVVQGRTLVEELGKAASLAKTSGQSNEEQLALIETTKQHLCELGITLALERWRCFAIMRRWANFAQSVAEFYSLEPDFFYQSEIPSLYGMQDDDEELTRLPQSFKA